MKAIVLDLETTVQILDDGTKDNSPFHPKNRIVSAHWAMVEDDIVPETTSLIFYHNEKPVPDSPEALQAALDEADVIVAHNAKYDVMYLLEAGFRIPNEVYCTMIGEYILARGQGLKYNLEDTADRREVTRKKSELVKDLFNSGIGFEAMPLHVVLEYAEADVQSCADIYLDQLSDYADAKNKGLVPVRKAMNEMLMFLVEIERNGVKIDLDALEDVEVQYLDERDEIHARLNAVVKDVMGDTPINLNSGADMSMVVYSRRVKDRNAHVMKFNIGTDHRGKPLYPPRMNPREFAAAVRETTEVVNRTLAQHCHTCSGTGKIHKVKKNGELFKKPSKCNVCAGRGFTLLDTGQVAGLKLVPSGPADASVLGFTTDKAAIKKLIHQAEAKGNLQAVQFLKDISRLNAVNTYLDSFVKGIQTWTRPDSILHPNFNQTTAKTGRLSSTKPNFQNQPKGGKFPVRKAVISRFENGLIVEADFSGLEFAVAGDLSRDNQILTDIATGKDVHKQTASIVNQCEVSDVNKDMRQDAKAYCVPMDTEALTRTGWKKYDQLAIGEEVLTYNQNTRTSEWKPILELAYFSDRPVIEYGHSHWKVRTTADHRWYGFRRRERSGGVRQYETEVFTAENITSEHNIITAAPCVDEGILPITPKQAAILGWVVSDGSYRFSTLPDGRARANGTKHGVTACVVQKKELQSLHIEQLLDGVSTSVSHRDCGTAVWNISAAAFREIWNAAELDMFTPNWVEFVSKCSPEARNQFLNSILLAEGHRRDHGEWRISQNQGSLADAIRVGLHLEGHDTRVTTHLSYTGKLHDVYTARKRSHITCQKFKTTNSSVEDVWCPRTENGTWVMRQGNVITVTGNTFAPLYGGQGANEPPHVQVYFREFFNIYQGLASYHKKLTDGVLKDGIVRIPSGREYLFTGVRRYANGRVSNQTAIVNYPVQGFATGDIVPLACVRALRRFREEGLRSKLILTVHDSIVVDCHPDELQQVKAALRWAMCEVTTEVRDRYGYEMAFETLKIEIAAGPNWLAMDEIPLD